MSIADKTSIFTKEYRDTNNIIRIGSRSFIDGIMDGLIPGADVIGKFGRGPSVDTGNVVQDEEGSIAINTVASAIEVISSDAADTAAGAGAKAIEVFGVDGDWNPISDTIVTAGTSASTATTNTYLYVYRARIADSGAVPNTGNITIRKSGAGATMAYITAGYGQTLKCMMPVFAGCKLRITNMSLEGIRTNTVTGEIALMEYALGEGIRCRHAFEFSVGSDINREFKVPIECNAKSLVWIQCMNISTPAVLTASFDGYFVRTAAS